MVNTLPPETTGAAARRAPLASPAPIETLNAWPSDLPSARWPGDLPGAPPGWLQSLFTCAGGSVIGMAAVAGSTEMSSSVARIEMRSPSTGVLGLPLRSVLHPASAAPSISAVVRVRKRVMAKSLMAKR